MSQIQTGKNFKLGVNTGFSPRSNPATKTSIETKIKMETRAILLDISVGLRFAFTVALALAFTLAPWLGLPASIVASRGPTAINHAILAITAPSPIFYGEDGQPLSPYLIATFNKVKAEEKKFDMNQVVPLDMPATDDGQQVFSRVADRGVTSFFNSPDIRQSSLGRVATQIEESVNQEVSLGEKGSVQHKLNFNLQAFQSIARIQYTGYANLAVEYKSKESLMGFEIFENIGENKQMVLNHKINPEQRLSSMDMRWSF